MFLKYLQIVNYKNLRSARFSFVEGVNTVIGENDSGKSNAMTALRILLDDTYYYNTKRLKENDFSDSLGNWKGHWIILSAVFGKITSEDKETEVCAGIVPENENEEFLKSYIKSGEDDIGVISLFIRPQKQVRKKLSEITDIAEFEEERKKIKISDYEFYYTSRAQTDFTDKDIYTKIVGDLEKGQCSDPDEDDDRILGCKLNIADVQDHISVVFIDALRDVASELGKPKNPIRRIIESVESLIKESELNTIKSEIVQLNKSISEVEQVELVGRKINEKLLDMIGMVYSPEIILQSGLKDDINSLSRYLFMKPSKQNDIDSLSDEIDNYKILKIINSISETDENGVVYLQKAINNFLIEIGIDLNIESRLQKAYEDFILKVKDRVKNNHLSSDIDTFKQCFKEKEGVVINTFHGVKGEEYTTVIAFGILNGYIPHWDTIINKPHYRESETKKLLYVVCSRAKQNLYLFSEQGRTTQKGAPLTSTDEIVAIDYKYDDLK